MIPVARKVRNSRETKGRSLQAIERDLRGLPPPATAAGGGGSAGGGLPGS